MSQKEMLIFVLGFISGLLMMAGLQRTSSMDNFVYRTIYQQQRSTEAGVDPLSHAHIDSLPSLNGTLNFDDDNHHKDDDMSVAMELSKKIRVLCWVMTSEDNLDKKAIHVKATWAKRCNKVLFVSDSLNEKFPTINITVEHGRDHLTAKTMKAFDYIHTNHLNDYDWFMKVDDDTFVILENLRYLLSSYSLDEPIYFGHLFKPFVPQGYYSGGGGYVFSREALRRFGARKQGVCQEDGGAEDVEIGKCMHKLGVKTADTRDANSRSRFHCFDVFTHMRGQYPEWYHDYDAHGSQKGVTSISDFPITFHYIKPEAMYEYEYFVYHLRAYGISNGHPKPFHPMTTMGKPTGTMRPTSILPPAVKPTTD